MAHVEFTDEVRGFVSQSELEAVNSKPFLLFSQTSKLNTLMLLDVVSPDRCGRAVSLPAFIPTAIWEPTTTASRQANDGGKTLRTG